MIPRRYGSFSKSRTVEVSRRGRLPNAYFSHSVPARRVDQVQNRRIRNLDKRVTKINNNIETKYVTNVIDFTADATSPVAVQLNNGIVRGDAPYQRDGQLVIGTSLRFKGYLTSAGGSTRYSIARIIIFWCKTLLTGPPNVTGDTTSGTAALLNTYMTTGTGPVAFALPYALEFIPHIFKPIYDKTIVLNPGAAVGTSGSSPITSSISTARHIKINLRFNKKIRYDSTSGEISDMAGNSLWLVVIPNNDTLPPVLSGVSRFCYRDS